ncbi:hypothetical protein DPEC_G00147600 [Dallia pectoralis]|uniref:Uncharacterized protein n=1 Tax=Dallia pectoralis TaxID=75939 RepID=A0ACC2GIH3_DALPE|nr:hypothetical protein DPEC_G00147600 [Dallia pectoralis]
MSNNNQDSWFKKCILPASSPSPVINAESDLPHTAPAAGHNVEGGGWFGTQHLGEELEHGFHADRGCCFVLLCPCRHLQAPCLQRPHRLVQRLGAQHPPGNETCNVKGNMLRMTCSVSMTTHRPTSWSVSSATPVPPRPMADATGCGRSPGRPPPTPASPLPVDVDTAGPQTPGLRNRGL